MKKNINKKESQIPFTFLTLITLFFFSNLKPSTSSFPQNDTVSLTSFRLETDTHGNLLSNWTGSDPCRSHWTGIACSQKTNRVVSLSLPSLSLRGEGLNFLAGLDQLRFLDLAGNRLNGTISPLTSLTNLKLVYLAGNDFSGEIPPEISSLRRILRLDLSDNNIAGKIPPEINLLTRILTLRLQNNMLAGEIPDLTNLPELEELNLTNNALYGRVSDSMVKKFGGESFSGNEGLCGSIIPLPNCSFTGKSVPSNPNPSSVPSDEARVEATGGTRGRRMSGGVIAAVVVANCVVLVVVLSCVVARCCARGGREFSGGSESGSKGRKSGSSYGGSGDKKVYANGGNGGDSDGTAGTDQSKLVFFDRKKGFELEDLLRASAEMLGKGSLGTVYRAVLDDGSTVAVKRLKDSNPCSRTHFEQYMDVIGKLRHPNVVRLRAYYYAKEEKLLVYDYLANGSLHQLLHGNRGPGRIPLDWTTRISLVLGAARGLARIHNEYSSAKIPHGNIKSSNVLFDKNGVACVSDFGLSLLLNPVHAIARLGGYRAPEQTEVKRLSQKADVYSFGVLLLEVLTGRAPSSQYPSPGDRSKPESEEEQTAAVDLPSWVRSVVKEEWTGEVFDQELLRYKNIEEELVSMLHIGLACVIPQPEKRPAMAQVAKMIEDIRVEQSPLGEDYESRDSLSTTEDGLP